MNAETASETGTIARIRKRPAMYIGDTGMHGLRQLLDEVLANACEEALYGGASHIAVCRFRDDSFSVKDDGRGIADCGDLPGLFGELRDGVRAEDEPKLAHGMCSGAVTVNALSETFAVTSDRDGRRNHREFQRGEPYEATVPEAAPTGRSSGTQVRWRPDPEIFGEVSLEGHLIRNRLRTLSYLLPGQVFDLRDELEGRFETYRAAGGLRDFVECVNTGRNALHAPVYAEAREGKIHVEVALQYYFGNDDPLIGFLNHRSLQSRGPHAQGVFAGLSDVLTPLASEYLRGTQERLCTAQVATGLAAVVSMRHPDPQFRGSYARIAGNSELEAMVRSCVVRALESGLQRDPEFLAGVLWQIPGADRLSEPCPLREDLRL